MSKIIVKTEEEIEGMREAGRCAARVLDEVKQKVVAGVSTWELDQFAKVVIDSLGAVSSAHGYGDKRNPYPSYVCISLNDEVVHGIGRRDVIVKDGDIVSLDVAVSYRGFVGDNTVTVGVGSLSKEKQLLLSVTEQALYKGIDQAIEGNRVGDISWAIQEFAEKHRLGIVRELVGHGVGRKMHEEPQVPNYGVPHTGPRLKAGMTIAIEPMLTLGLPKLCALKDGWTVVTCDGSCSAHFEHTILITKDSPEILTTLKK